MDVKQVRAIAREHGIKLGKLTKGDLIRAIQRGEGNFDCFGTASGNHCSQEACLWRGDCLKGQQAA